MATDGVVLSIADLSSFIEVKKQVSLIKLSHYNQLFHNFTGANKKSLKHAPFFAKHTFLANSPKFITLLPPSIEV